ncbi:DUF433 domain-containing protein [Terrimonas pollutisoli]|uniref:DUF433 domain-containing protein n=1 Tax=Terrimonas pollutisoli TaxID=3034147 RepID=UPI0023EAA6A3|nr:DUF433 domain-containing protein [Terrimonas sp. H1YJ31]
MITISHKQQLGTGIYTVPDIGRLLGLPQAKVRRYLNEYWDERLGKRFFNETYSWSAGNNIKAVNFYTLIELYTCFHLQELGVSPRQILKSRVAIAEDLRIPYPFASANLLSDGKKIWYEFKDSVVNADGSKQTDFVEFIRKFANKIEFNSSKIAEKFWPAGRKSDVVINPHHQFGQPVLNGTNINAEVIFSMYESGESVESLGILYDLTQKQVNDAISFYKKSTA